MRKCYHKRFTIGEYIKIVLQLIVSLIVKLKPRVTNPVIVDQQNNVGMDGDLVDSEGFPRSDVDVQCVRLLRRRVIR